MTKRIAILTSGGDCPGLNAVLRAVALHASRSHGWEVIGIREGLGGLLARPVGAETLAPERFDGFLLRQAGTVLGTTNKGDPFAYPRPGGDTTDRSAEVIEGWRALEADALIGVGGDGSLRILRDLAAQGDIPLIGIPKTIDNDVAMTEVSVGFDSAVAVAADALDHLQPTAASHSRVMILETMGRDAGHIALAAGVAGGADVILIPEIAYDLERIAAHIAGLRERDGRTFALMVVAEATPSPDGAVIRHDLPGGGSALGGVGHVIAERLSEKIAAEIRVTQLGHLQRGGAPSPRDRFIASAFGVHAVDLLAAGKRDRMVAWQNRGLTDVALGEVVARNHRVDPAGALMKTARGLGVCFGD